MLVANAIDDKPQIGRFAGVLKSWGGVRLVAAATKNEKVRTPAAPLRFPKETPDVVRPYRPLESVKKQQPRRAGFGVGAEDVDEVSIRGRPTFRASMQRLTPAKELRPQRLCMCSRYPPCWTVGMFASSHQRFVPVSTPGDQ